MERDESRPRTRVVLRNEQPGPDLRRMLGRGGEAAEADLVSREFFEFLLVDRHRMSGRTHLRPFANQLLSDFKYVSRSASHCAKVFEASGSSGLLDCGVCTVNRPSPRARSHSFGS